MERLPGHDVHGRRHDALDGAVQWDGLGATLTCVTAAGSPVVERLAPEPGPISSRALEPTIVATAISILALAHYLFLLNSSRALLVGVIPDDAFYELQIARHFLATGQWSFDRGLSTTTGFHLLNTYLMSLFPQLMINPWLAIKFWMGIGVALSIGAIFMICRIAARTFGDFSLIFAFLVLNSAVYTTQSASLLEFPYVIVAAALYVAVVFRTRKESGFGALVAIFVLGVLGSLARSDFGGLPLAIFVACGISYCLNRRTDYLIQSLCGLVGATVGLIAVFLHNYFFSGHFLSDSAIVKALWGRRVGYSLKLPLIKLAQTVAVTKQSAPLAGVLFVIAMVVIAAVAIGKWRAPRREGAVAWTYENKLLAGAGSIAIALYVLVYGTDPGVQHWYAANFVLPWIFVLGAASRATERDRVLRVFAVFAVALLSAHSIRDSYRPIWRHQRYMLEMAEYLEAHPVDGRIAGWNVGIVGFFNDGRVINLDGLMNDEVYPFVQAGTVAEYLNQAGVKFVVDFPEQVTNPQLARMLGYDGARLRAELKPIHTIANENRDDMELDYTLYAVERHKSETGGHD